MAPASLLNGNLPVWAPLFYFRVGSGIHRLMVLGDFNFSFLGMESIIAQETWDGGYTPDLIFLSKQWSSDLDFRELFVIPLHWWANALGTMWSTPSHIDMGLIWLVLPWWLNELERFQRELEIVPNDLYDLEGFVMRVTMPWIRLSLYDFIFAINFIAFHGLQNCCVRWNGRKDVQSIARGQ